MGAIQQILFGTGLLTFSALVHVGVIAWSIPLLVKLASAFSEEESSPVRTVSLLAFCVFTLVLAHTVQVGTWAIVFLNIANLSDLATSFYFAAVTYTTLGYGDIVLGSDTRIVATFCAITGLLTFGISTAFLIGVLSRILPRIFGNDPQT